jgi:hypothetical protein
MSGVRKVSKVVRTGAYSAQDSSFLRLKAWRHRASSAGLEAVMRHSAIPIPNFLPRAIYADRNYEAGNVIWSKNDLVKWQFSGA